MISTLFALTLVGRFNTNQLIRLLVVLGVCEGLASLLLIIAMPAIGIQHHDGSGAWRGLFVHKNIYGLAMVDFLGCSMYVTLTGALRYLKRGALLAFFAVQIIGSQAKTAWVLAGELMAMFLLLRIVKPFNRREVRMLAPSVLLIVPLLVPLFISWLPTLYESLGKDSTLTGRTLIWEVVMGFILRRPILGYGYNAFWTGRTGDSAAVAYQTGWHAPTAHSGYLEIWLELGFVGLCLFGAMAYRAFRDAASCYGPTSPDYVSWYVVVILLTLVSSIDEVGIFSALTLPWMIFVMCCAGLSMEAKRVRTNRQGVFSQRESRDVLFA